MQFIIRMFFQFFWVFCILQDFKDFFLNVFMCKFNFLLLYYFILKNNDLNKFDVFKQVKVFLCNWLLIYVFQKFDFYCGFQLQNCGFIGNLGRWFINLNFLQSFSFVVMLFYFIFWVYNLNKFKFYCMRIFFYKFWFFGKMFFKRN